jgi:aspartyl-tRNA(Asn)/glutamyl-tRNA(Gln) amidotransferase subunit B
MPLLPEKKREKYENLGLTREQIEVIISRPDLDSFFALVIDSAPTNEAVIRLGANYLISDVLSLPGVVLRHEAVPSFIEMLELLLAKKVTSRIAKDFLPQVLDGASLSVIIEEHGLARTTDTQQLYLIISDVIAENQPVVADYQAGKVSAVQFLVGQVMKKSRGTADPELARRQLESRLAE